MAATPGPATHDDSPDLASFGYSQSLHRRLHFFSSFAAAFSYGARRSRIPSPLRSAEAAGSAV